MLMLSPIDHVFVGKGAYAIEFVFHYPAGLDAAKMKRSLEDVLAAHWPLSCTLAVIGERYAFVPASHAVELEEARIDAKLSLADGDQLERFIPGVRSLLSEPLCRLRLTHGTNGSVLGVSISHALADGFSYFSFLFNWAQATRGRQITPVSHARELLSPLNGPSIMLSAKADLERLIGWSWSDPRVDVARREVQTTVIHYAKEEIALLQADAQTVPLKLSVNDLLCADLWKRMVERSYCDEREVSFVTAVDFRRLLQRVPPNYMGNAVMLSHTRLPTQEVLRMDTRALASALRTSMQAATSARCENTIAALDAMRTRHGLAALEEVHVADPYHGFLLTNLSRLPVRSLDFGSGSPSRVVPVSRFPGTASVLPGADGSLEIHVSLPQRAATDVGATPTRRASSAGA